MDVVQLLGELGKRDPVAAGRLARAAWDQVAAFRPEAPAVPTATPGREEA